MTATPTPHILKNPPAPGSPEWVATITASKIPPMIRTSEGTYAGFGYLTAWETYEQLHGRHEQKFNDHMLKRFASAHEAEQHAVRWWIDQQDVPADWEVTGHEVAYTHPGYTFNGRHPIATLDDVATHIPTGRQIRLEVKNPDSAKVDPGWLIQTFAQQEWSGIPDGELIIWPINGDPQIIPTRATSEQIAAAMEDVAAFAALIDAGTPPGDGDHELSDLLLAELEKAQQSAADAAAHLDEVKAKIAASIGNHKRATYNGKAIATRQAGRFAKGRIPAEYRDIVAMDDYQLTTTKFDEKKFATDHPEAYAAALGTPSFKFL